MGLLFSEREIRLPFVGMCGFIWAAVGVAALAGIADAVSVGSDSALISKHSEISIRGTVMSSTNRHGFLQCG
jgi:hypothetical protein